MVELKYADFTTHQSGSAGRYNLALYLLWLVDNFRISAGFAARFVNYSFGFSEGFLGHIGQCGELRAVLGWRFVVLFLSVLGRIILLEFVNFGPRTFFRSGILSEVSKF